MRTYFNGELVHLYQVGSRWEAAVGVFRMVRISGLTDLECLARVADFLAPVRIAA